MSEQQNTEEQTTLGAYLKRLRNEKNISVAEVAARMYLNKRVIEALERDDHDNLHGPLYIYGYLRHYAKILDVPADDLVALFKKSTDEPQEQAAETQKQAPETQKQVETTPNQPEPETKQPVNWLRALLYLVLFILVLASFAFWRGKYAQEPAGQTGSVDTPVSIVEQPPTQSEQAQSAEMDDPEQTPAAPGEPETETIPEAEAALAPEIAPDPAPAPGPVDEARTIGTQLPETPTEIAGSETEVSPAYEITMITAGTGPDTVTLVLSYDCWIEIFDANNDKVFYGLARTGQTLVLAGTAPFSVLLGNANSATVEFNSRPFDITPHITGIGIARFVLGETG